MKYKFLVFALIMSAAPLGGMLAMLVAPNWRWAVILLMALYGFCGAAVIDWWWRKGLPATQLTGVMYSRIKRSGTRL